MDCHGLLTSLLAACALGCAGTSPDATTGGSGGDAACVPASIVGINRKATGHQVARLDPQTGDLKVLGPAPEELIGFHAYDPANRQLYQLGSDLVYAIDGSTGAVLYSTSLPGGSGKLLENPVVDDAGRIVVLSLSMPVDLAVLDPRTGVLTDLATTPYGGGYEPSNCAFDGASKRIYQIGKGFVLTFDAGSGEVIANVGLSQDFRNAVIDVTGRIVGVHSANGVTTVATLDAMSGVVTDLAPLSGATTPGGATYDPCTNRIYQIAGFQVTTVDAATGETLAQAMMAEQGFFHAQAIY